MNERVTPLLDSGVGLCQFGTAWAAPCLAEPGAPLQRGISDMLVLV